MGSPPASVSDSPGGSSPSEYYPPPAGPTFGPPTASWTFSPPVPELLGRIRDGAKLYLLVLSIQLALVVLSVSFFGYSAGAGPLASLVGVSLASANLAVSVVVTLLSIVLLILVLVSWLRWRDGVRPLPRSAPSLGASYVSVASSAARDYARTVWAYIAALAFSVGSGFALEFIAASHVGSTFCETGSTGQTCTTTVSSSTETLIATLAFGLFLQILFILVYYFSTRSLRGALRPLASPLQQQQLDRGRIVMLAGAAIAPVSLLNVGLALGDVSLGAFSLVGVISPVLLVYGMYQIYHAYDVWCRAHPPSQAMPPV
jgi:hypothetical protein